MWNGEKSISLSKMCIFLFIGVLIVVAVFAPWLVRWFLSFSRADLMGRETFFLTTIYTGFVPAAYLLYCLLRLLNRIEAEEVFIPINVERLRRISWSCFLGAAVAFLSAFYYLPWIFVAISAAFMGLIVRVVKNVVAKAVDLQHEVDFTV
ncbi:MAG: DUF2975 domain-containing protein [Dehalobacterium sp.]|jgi:hypothetical protein